jgi:outer membrane autotransporter protein
MQSRRFVEIGDDFEALAEADWWAFEGHASARASAPMALTDWFFVTPQAQLTYVALQESSYTEDGGGIGINYDVDAAFSQRLWADLGVEFSGRFGLTGESVLAPRIFVGYRANVLDEAGERTMRFVDGGSDFTLVDDEFGSGGALVGIGLDATNGYSTFSLGYEGEFSDQVERHSLNASIRFRF